MTALPGPHRRGLIASALAAAVSLSLLVTPAATAEENAPRRLPSATNITPGVGLPNPDRAVSTVRTRIAPTGDSASLDAFTPATTTRIGGANRYEVAVAISQRTFGAGVPVVYIASGLAFADGLAGSAAAAHEGGPLLLVENGIVPDVTAAELARLRPARIVIQGGPATVSTAVEDALRSYAVGGNVVRNGGANRYEVAINTSKRAFGSAKTVYVASGAVFADALSGSAAAAHEGAPLLLTDQATTLPAGLAAEISRLGATRARVLGGPAPGRPPAERVLRNQLGAGNVDRMPGANRYGVAAVASKVFASATTAIIAKGSDYPDALTGGPLAAAKGAPLFLVETNCIPSYVLDRLAELGVTNVIILGGTGSVSASAAAMTSCPLPAAVAELNSWRARYGVPALKDDPEAAGSLAAHVYYATMTGLAGEPEDPANEWYTPAGASAQPFSMLTETGLMPLPDSWMRDPMNALILLHPSATIAGWYQGASYTGLLTGWYADKRNDAAAMSWPKSWPRGATTLEPLPFTGYVSWLCPSGTLDQTGGTRVLAPVTSFGPSAPAITSATSKLTKDGVVVPTCTVSESSLSVADDPDYQSWGRSVLADNHSVATVPGVELTAGSYTLTVTTNAGSSTSTFTIG